MTQVGQANQMTGYIIEYEDGFEDELSKVMPGAVWKTWTPTYSDLVEHGKLVIDLSSRILAVLKPYPAGSRVSSRKLKTLCQAEAVASQTWTRAIKKALEAFPSWIQQDQSLSNVTISL